MIIVHKLINRFLKLFEISHIKTQEKAVFLTFDDGPEPDICEFVLDELAKYGFKATFFCGGKNAEMHPLLMQRIINEGHSIGNHSYSHSLHPYTSSPEDYAEDIFRADKVLKTPLFRPPWGSLSLGAFLRLVRFKIYYWTTSSGDSSLDISTVSAREHLCHLIEKTQRGDIVLFHFCTLHEQATRLILPGYLKWLRENDWTSKAL